MCGYKEMRLGGVKLHSLNNTLGLSERALRVALTDGVDINLSGALEIVSHSCKVVSLGVPCDLLNDVAEVELDTLDSSLIIFKHPLEMLLLLLVKQHFLFVSLFSDLKKLRGTLVRLRRVQLGLEHVN